MVRVIKDNFRHKRTLLKWLRRLAPLHVYYTTSAWLNPQGIGPDPKGKHGKAKMKKKGWTLERYHDTMLYQGLYFDVDYDNADYNEGANMLFKLKSTLDDNVFKKYRRKRSPQSYFLNGLKIDPIMVFSGSKGFHLVYEVWASERLDPLSMMRYSVLAKGGHQQEFHRMGKTKLVNYLKSVEGLLLDWEVTQDPRRIIRLPGTIHGKTLRLCKIVTEDDFELRDTYHIFNADAPIA